MSKKTIVKVLLKTSLLLRTKDTQNWKTDYYLIQYKLKNKWSPKSENRKSSPCSIFGDTFTNKYTTIPQTYKRFSNLI
jgi:hypothetical protein